MRRNLRWLDLAATTPENVCIGDREVAQAKVLINGRLVIEKQLFIRAVRHGHDVDVLEFRPRFAPVTMRQNMMTANLAARFNFTTRGHGPVK